MELTEEVKKHRKAGYDIHPLFLNRWSPRAMSGEKLEKDELMALFEAARWAPSAFNNQLWKYIYAERDSEHWDTFLNLLVEFNQSWCKDAAALVVVISRKDAEYNDKPAPTHEFDAGASWENLALEGAKRDLVIHGMAGFDYEKAKKQLEVPDNYKVLAMIAIGKRGKTEDLPKEVQEKEIPSDRRPLKEIAIEGKFKGK
ncbi:nitroreductase family protein [Candidatus Woesearchaeota archaeon]|nr:nitroreductase family protein [Candidatus Woesearchaeota archaeon]